MVVREAPGKHQGDALRPARWLILFLLGLVGAVARPSPGQVDLLQQMDRQAGVTGEIELKIESVGLGNAARPGEWAGIRLRMTDRGSTQREVLVRAVITDVDGDDAQYETVVTTNPGVGDQPVWLYARIPFDMPQTGGFVVSAFEAEETDDAANPVGFVASRPLGQTAYRWGQTAGRNTGILAVVGNTPGGLSGYTQRAQSMPDTDPLGHEVSVITTLSTAEALPDRWMGLAMVREIIWNGESPNNLRIEQVRALREWVERGGHLVVILPAVGQDWLALSNRELADILPRVEVTRLEAEPLRSLRPLLTDADPRLLSVPDVAVTVYTFAPMADSGAGEADRILNDASGRCVVVSRSVGVGAVTMIGLPGWHPALTGKGLPEADVFWHRVLGRRGKVATDEEFTDLNNRNQIPNSRTAWTVDGDISATIGKSGRSLAGVMLGLIVFIAYWIVAGPGGFALLKQRKLAHHAWVAFVGAAMVFTALSWGGATALRPKRVEVSHLSFLDHVYGQRVQRVRSWVSVLVPVYGDAEVWLESDDAAAAGGSRFVQAVAPWEPAQDAARGSFPDARDYAVDSRDPQRLTFPARATVKQLQLDWAGGMAWDSVRPQVAEGADPFRAVRFSEPGSSNALEGTLIHNLPGMLEDVEIFLFRRQVPVRASAAGGPLLTSANAWAIQPSSWEPGTVLDLSAVTINAQSTALHLAGGPLDTMVKGASDGLPTAGSRGQRLRWLAFFNLLGPPERNNNYQPAAVARREATHGLDLSRWSTRPCVIIIGTLRLEGQDAAPVPMGVATNGTVRKPYYSGPTVVRWVYPLPDDPPEVPVVTMPEAGVQPGAGS